MHTYLYTTDSALFDVDSGRNYMQVHTELTYKVTLKVTVLIILDRARQTHR